MHLHQRASFAAKPCWTNLQPSSIRLGLPDRYDLTTSSMERGDKSSADEFSAFLSIVCVFRILLESWGSFSESNQNFPVIVAFDLMTG